jgi:sugar phosphate isomerase/epimerase
VYGSSGSRNVPDGYSRDKANDEIVSFLKIIAGPAKLHGVAIAIEPLGRAECNIINTVDEGVEIAQRVGLPQQITVLADLYHMLCNGESLASVQRAASLGLLSHVHVACGRDRHSPRPEDIDTLREFLSYAKQAPVVPRCSLECRLVDFEHDAHVALDVLKEATR